VADSNRRRSTGEYSNNIKTIRKITSPEINVYDSRKKANHQFGFRSKYAIVEHIHRITNEITLAFEAEK